MKKQIMQLNAEMRKLYASYQQNNFLFLSLGRAATILTSEIAINWLFHLMNMMKQ